MSDVLVLDDIRKSYGRFIAVDGFSLRLERGLVLGFLGPNGAGKTTTIRMVMSIIHPDSGTISIFGRARASDVKDRIGYLPEERGLYRKMTVAETLSYFGKLKGLSGRDLSDRIERGLARVGLGDWKGKKVEALSKGMQQKVQFVATLLNDPELLILDEPFSGLDPLNVDLLERLIIERRDAGATIIFSTHQMNQAERMCDRIVLINRGRKVIEGTIPEVRGRFASRMIVIDADGDLTPLRRVPGVRTAHITAGHAEIELSEEVEPNTLLTAAAQTASVHRFEVQSHSLHEIFLRLVGSSNDGERVAVEQPLEVVRA